MTAQMLAPPSNTVSSFRLRACAASLLGAGVLIAGSELTTPNRGNETTAELLQRYVDHPVLTQTSALLLHFGALLVLPGIVGILQLLRTRSTRLGHVGAALAFVGWATLAGNVVTDFFALSAGQQLGIENGATYLDATEALGGAAPLIVPAFLGSFLGMVLLLIALGRAGELAWAWVAAGILGIALTVVGPTYPVIAAGFLALSVTLGRIGVRLYSISTGP